MEKTLLEITQVGQLVGVLGPIAFDAALKIKHLLELDPDTKVNTVRLIADARSDNGETMTKIQDWFKAQNLPVPGV